MTIDIATGVPAAGSVQRLQVRPIARRAAALEAWSLPEGMTVTSSGVVGIPAGSPVSWTWVSDWVMVREHRSKSLTEGDKARRL